jgi:hypothetical protein
MKTSLTGLGFRRNQIYEAVISTLGTGGKPNAAPMGIITRPPRTIILRPFKTSLTYHNLKTMGCGVANITLDPEVFFKTAFKRTYLGERIPVTWFTRSKISNAPALKCADLKIAFRVTSVEDFAANRANFICKVQDINIRRVLPRAYCRGDFAAIECVIHATRVREFLARGQDRKAAELMRLIRYYAKLAKRVSPDSKNTWIIGKLLSYTGRWRSEHESSR